MELRDKKGGGVTPIVPCHLLPSKLSVEEMTAMWGEGLWGRTDKEGRIGRGQSTIFLN